MEPKRSSPHSQAPTTFPYPEPAQSSTRLTSHFLQIRFSIMNYPSTPPHPHKHSTVWTGFLPLPLPLQITGLNRISDNRAGNVVVSYDDHPLELVALIRQSVVYKRQAIRDIQSVWQPTPPLHHHHHSVATAPKEQQQNETKTFAYVNMTHKHTNFSCLVTNQSESSRAVAMDVP